MTVRIEGLPRDRALRALIVQKLEKLSSRLPRAPLGTRVTLTDVNGPKGGVDARCAITVQVPGVSPLHAEEVAETSRLAFEAAFDTLERTVLRERSRLRDRGRRPKKYFVAKRLLTSGSRPTQRGA